MFLPQLCYLFPATSAPPTCLLFSCCFSRLGTSFLLVQKLDREKAPSPRAPFTTFAVPPALFHLFRNFSSICGVVLIPFFRKALPLYRLRFFFAAAQRLCLPGGWTFFSEFRRRCSLEVIFFFRILSSVFLKSGVFLVRPVFENPGPPPRGPFFSFHFPFSETFADVSRPPLELLRRACAFSRGAILSGDWPGLAFFAGGVLVGAWGSPFFLLLPSSLCTRDYLRL